MRERERGYGGLQGAEAVLDAVLERPHEKLLPVPPRPAEQIVFFNLLDLHHKPPDSGERQYKLRTREGRFDPALKRQGVAVREQGKWGGKAHVLCTGGYSLCLWWEAYTD